MVTALGLADAGHAVRLLERRPFLGGRVYSFHDAELGRGLDNGQHAMLGCYRETLAFLDRLGVAGLLHWQGLRMEMREHGRRGVLRAGHVPAPFHLSRALLGYRLLSRTEQLGAMVAAVRLLDRWKRGPTRLAEQTVRGLLADLGQSESVSRRLWDPIAIAALNVHPTRACAALFAAVIERAFFGRARDAAIVLPGAPLAEIFGGPGEAALRQAGVEVCSRAALAHVDLDETGEVAGVRTRDGNAFDCDAVVLALPPRAVAGISIAGRLPVDVLGGWVDALQGTVPIVSAHVSVDHAVDLPEMVGLIGTTTQWLFHTDLFQSRGANVVGPSLLSCVTSDAGHLDGCDDREIARTTADEIGALVPELGPVDPKRIRIVREKHATIAATIEATAARPGTETTVPGLLLAGDWVDTGLPATIESAALSGRMAVTAVAAMPSVRSGAPRGACAA